MIKHLYQNYIATLENCGIYLLNASDLTIEHQIFEEFDIGITSFLYPDNLKILLDEGFINETIFQKSVQLRSLCFRLQVDNLWDILYLKSHADWKTVMLLSDEIKELIKAA